MKLEYINGCTCTSLEVDGVESIDMPLNNFKKAIHKMIDNTNDLGELQMIFTNYMELHGKHTDHGVCECCGDHIDSYSLTIE